MPIRFSLLVALGLLLAVSAAWADIPVVDLDSEIHAVSAGYVVRAIERADRDGAPLVIIQMNTPGGLMSSMRQIIDKVLVSRTPVAVFVGPSGARAASAGFIIAITADVVAMAPGTNMGAAHPVLATGAMDEVMSKKIASDTAAYIRSKAEQRGRNADMAEKAVLDSKSFTEREAKDAHLIDFVVKDADELVRTLDGKTVKRFDGREVRLDLKGEHLARVEMSWRESVLAAVASPDIIFLLLLGALAGLGTEISHPGLLFPGIIGALCLVLFLFASSVIPVSGAGVLLIVLAIGLFAAELKVPSYGLLTVSGIVAMILGAMMLVDAPYHELRVSLMTIVPAVFVMALWATLVVRLVLNAQRSPVTTGVEGIVGASVVAETDLDPSGWVRLRGESWRAVADQPASAGEGLKVTSVDGLTLHVRKES